MTNCALLVMPSDNRGLASADEEKRERVAKAGGKARAQDKERLPDAGHKGEQTVSQSKEIMLEIGKKGGQK